MFDPWDFINAELSGKVRTVISSLDATDPWLLAVPIFVAVFLGSKMVGGQPHLRRLGLRLGVAVFLVYGGYRFYQAGGFSARMAIEAVNAGGFVLAVTWTLLPIITFVYAHLRLALAAFIGYTGYALATATEFSQDQLSGIALRGLVAVGLALLVAWILHPIWDFFRDLLPRPSRQSGANGEEEELPARLGRRSRRRRGLETRKIEPEITIRPAPMPPVPAPPTPVTVPPPNPSAEQVEMQRRRDRTRLQIELAYVLALPRIGERFARATFDDFVQRFLGDHLPLEDVEANGRQLLEILQEHQRQAQEQAVTPAPPSDAVIAMVREEKAG